MKIDSSFIHKKGEKAQSLVELAISLIVMLMLLLGAIEFSLALFQYVTIRDAAQEAAVYASINPNDDAGIKEHALSAANDVLILNATDVALFKLGPGPVSASYCEGSTGGVPNYVTVTITYYHNITYPLVTPMIGTNKIKLTASATNTILTPSCTAP